MLNERLRETVDELCVHIADREGVDSLLAILNSIGLTKEELIELGWMEKE